MTSRKKLLLCRYAVISYLVSLCLDFPFGGLEYSKKAFSFPFALHDSGTQVILLLLVQLCCGEANRI